MPAIHPKEDQYPEYMKNKLTTKKTSNEINEWQIG
jgi:hypothetical protein